MPKTVELDADQAKASQALLTHLLAIREKLMMVDPTSLDADDHSDWTDQIYYVSVAIGYVQSLELDSVAKKYANLVEDAEKATDEVTNDLYALQKNVEAIKIVSGVLGVIQNIAALA